VHTKDEARCLRLVVHKDMEHVGEVSLRATANTTTQL
jgi:hypothetical protein